MGYNEYILGDDDDLLGDVDILGDDDDVGDEVDVLGALEILGASRRGRRNRKRSKGRAAVARAVMARNATLVRRANPSAVRNLTLGVDSGTTAVAAGASTTVTVNPVEPFRCTAFMVDPTIAPSFLITSILVGRKSQLVGTASISAATFSALNPLARVSWDTAQTSQPISIAITNNSGGALRFLATLFGDAVDVG